MEDKSTCAETIILAGTAGFCMGVDMALKKLDKIIEEQADGSPIQTLGPIIHNPQVLQEYGTKGISVADTPDQVAAGSHVLIRAHGIPREVEDRLYGLCRTVVDATCPRVKKAQILIRRHTGEGQTLLLYGESNHPEVRGLLSYAQGPSLVLESREEFQELELDPDTRYCLAAQTTQDRMAFSEIAQRLSARLGDRVTILETICDATRDRQDEAISIAESVDHMVVAGGYNSGNTRRLAQVVEDLGVPCVHVETAAELPLDKLAQARRIGLTAGASTPRSIIEEIYDRLRSLPRS
jgi:4-hydroxy-3-methylbut-2-enyl diphosphate reductase